MWNLLKNVFRSLSKNKIAIIGLSFLIFISIGVYTVLTSCTANISKTYKNICEKSNLHDFTVNELYKTSDPVFQLCDDSSNDAKWSTGTSTESGDPGGYSIPWANTNTSIGGDLYTRTYYFELNYDDQSGDNSVIYDFWKEHKDDSAFDYLLYPELTITNVELEYLSHETSPHVTSDNKETVNAELEVTKEQEQINAFIQQSETELLSYVNNLPTPMQEHMDELKKSGTIEEYQKFRALNINSSSDGIYYKMVEANQEDKIDKITTFSNYKNLKDTNFSANNDITKHRDYNPLARFGDKYGQLLLARDDTETNKEDVIHHKLPAQYATTDSDAATYNEAKILLLSLSNETTGLNDVWGNILDLAKEIESGNGWNSWVGTDVETKYNNFVTVATPNSETVYNKGYRLSVRWSNLTERAWHIDLWNSKFAFVNPQFMDANKKKPLDASLYKTNRSYKNYKNGDAPLEDWLNSIPYSDGDNSNKDIAQATTFKNWFDIICSQYPQYTAANTSGLETQYIILGAGITANFIYPIVSLDRLMPNYKKECIIFTNTIGYQRINDAFRSSEVESYLVGKFNNGENNKSKILNAINNSDARKEMSYPSSMDVAYMYNDTNNILSPAALRVAFIPLLIDKLGLISAILTIFILLLAILICIFVINQYISSKRMEIGIMRANGFRRRKIVFSLIPFAIIPSIIGGVVGYIVGFALQGVAVGLFHNYWTIPTSFSGFNVWTLLVGVFIPFLVCFVVSTATTAFMLRKPTVQLFKSDGDYKANIISKYVKRPFAAFGAVTKFRISLAFNFIWKLLILAIMSALAMTSIVFALSVNGKFDYAKNTTYNSQKYTYATDLYSPTNQGGQYIPYDSSWIGQNGFVKSAASELPNFIPNNMYDRPGEGDLGEGVDGSYKEIFTDYTNGIDHLSKDYYQSFGTFAAAMQQSKTFDANNQMSFANVLYPDMTDGIGQRIDINYLKNRSMTKSYMNFNVGFGSLATNPWKIATSLMPENNSNIADFKTQNLINVAHHEAITNPDWIAAGYAELFKNPTSSTTQPINYELDPSKCVMPLGMGLTPEFLEFEHHLYNPNFQIGEDKSGDCDYNIQYNEVPMNNEDETYTYLSTTGLSKNIKGDNIKIVGLKDDSKYVSLIDKKGQDIKDAIKVNLNNYSSHPMIVNAFAAKKHNLKIGDQIQVDIKNKANRFDLQLNNATDPTTTQTFKIVGINQTFQNEEYFISQDLANELLGLRNNLNADTNVNNWYYNYELADGGIDASALLFGLPSGQGALSETYDFSHLKDIAVDESKCNLTPYGFNGIFTNQKNGGLLNNGFYVYSPSGLYPASDMWASDSIKKVMQWGANTEIANEIVFNQNYSNDIARNIREKYLVYANEPDDDNFNALIANAEQLISIISNTFGASAYVQTISNVIDKVGQQQIYDGLSSTINTLEIVILTCVTLLVSLIVVLISSLLINNSKRMGAVLKALGYSDASVLSSFLSIYVPTILLGLLIAIPISILMVFGFVNIIFGIGGILLISSTHWWYYLIGIAGIIGLLSISGAIGYRQLTKESVASRLKTN